MIIHINPEIVVTWLGVITALLGIIAWVGRQTHRLSEMLSDWRGTEARPGVARRPGVMERLEKIESDISDVKKNVERK
mgnify:FL=1|jgi:hypothetical protein